MDAFNSWLCQQCIRKCLLPSCIIFVTLAWQLGDFHWRCSKQRISNDYYSCAGFLLCPGEWALSICNCHGNDSAGCYHVAVYQLPLPTKWVLQMKRHIKQLSAATYYRMVSTAYATLSCRVGDFHLQVTTAMHEQLETIVCSLFDTLSWQMGAINGSFLATC